MKKLTILLLLLLSVGQLTAQKAENHNSQVARNMDIMSEVYRQLDLWYVDSLNADTVMQWGINAMLNQVDPYTAYYPEEDDELMAVTQGKYAGIGSVIRFHKKLDRVVISEPYKDSPSDKAGLKAGDIIMSIDDKDVKGWPTSKVSNMLRGEAGTTFQLKVQRPGEPDTRTMTITRQTIAIPHIPYYGCVREGVGYIYLTGFNDGDAQQVRAALMEMKEQGAKKLILDLRDNPGGALDESVDIASLFLPKGTKIVYTKGKTGQANREYYTRLEPIDTVMPLVVMVDGGSASAAEILSGSLQDMDRAVIMGTRTYGKGLVQSFRELPYGGSLKLTISRYHIPSGRCIQARDYRHLNPDGSAKTLPDSLTNVFYTKGGREVRDGGGIKPDIEVIPDTMSTIAFDLSTSDALFDYATHYAQTHSTIAKAGDFHLTDQEFEEFIEYAKEAEFTYNKRSEEMLKMLRDMARQEGYLEEATAEFDALQEKLKGNLRTDILKFRDEIEDYICDEILRRYYYQAGAIRQHLDSDKTFNRALELLQNEKEYRKVLAPL